MRVDYEKCHAKLVNPESWVCELTGTTENLLLRLRDGRIFHDDCAHTGGLAGDVGLKFNHDSLEESVVLMAAPGQTFAGWRDNYKGEANLLF